MKQLLMPTLVALLFLAAAGCKDDCDNAPSFDKCSETPETHGTACQAHWETWIYDQSTGECQKRGYSGCEPLGFETQEECELCDCHRLENAE